MSTVNDWLWARDNMKRARSKDRGKKLMGNTWLVVSEVSPTDDWKSDEVVYAVQHWYTEVVRYFPNGVVAASLGGWNTVTTKMRVRRFSPIAIGTDGGRVGASAMNGSSPVRWTGNEDTWFYWKQEGGRNQGYMCFRDGGQVPNLLHARRKDTIPKSRDTLCDPREGDAFRDRQGLWVVAKDLSSYPRRLALFAYLGDHPDDRSLCVIPPGTPTPRELPDQLELLSTAHSGGLKPINRFVWKRPV